MSMDPIVREDIRSWNSIQDIADTLEKRGFERTDLGEEDEIVLEIDDDEFLAIVRADAEKTTSDYRTRMNANRHTQVVSTADFEEFTFTTRRRSWDKHGRIRYQHYKIEKSMFEDGGAGRSALDKLNQLEPGKPETINQLYDTKKVVSEFYDKFEEIQAKMVHNIADVPDDAGEAKRNYAQTIFDRLIFLHFIQEKKLLDYKQDYLERHHTSVIAVGNDVYKEFYRPLFFNWLSSDTAHGRGTLPYLNGGLFTKTDIEKKYPNIRLGETTEETNQLFTEILEFLGDWNWHADERLDIVDPNRLSPELLGHIFEKTVNQKEMGAYYTPEEITHFMARNTIHPYILDRLNEQFDRDYEEIDAVFAVKEDTQEQEGETTVIGELDDITQEEITYLYFDILQNLKVLDPAVGSGAFLLAAEEILLDIYLSCITYFERLANERGYEMTRRLTDLIEKLEDDVANPSMHAKRQIILNNLYGVDIDKGATEICKLRLWLSIVADLEKGDDPHDVEALPNIDFNIRQGNSLIGFTEPIEKALNDNIDDDAAQANLNQYSADAVHKRYQEIINKIKTYKRHEKEGNGEKAEQARQEVFEKLEEYREEPDEKILQQFHEAGIDDVGMEDIKEFSPFHWVLEFAEVYSEGGFDVIIGNPPWEVLTPNRDDFFSKYDEVFRTRMPGDKDKKQEELLQDSKIEQGWQEYQKQMEQRAEYFNNSGIYTLQTPEVAGKTVANENDLSALFFERVFELAKDNSYLSQILPGFLWNGASGKDLRAHLLDNTQLESLIVFENNGIFNQIHHQYKFGIPVLKNSGNTETVLGKYSQGDIDVLRSFNSEAVQVPREVLEAYSPEARIFPYIKSQEQIDALHSIVKHPPLGEDIEGAWSAVPYRELDRAQDADRLIENEENGDYPVFAGSNIFQFCYSPEFVDNLDKIKFWSVAEHKNSEKSAKRRIREKNFRSRDPEISLKKAIYGHFNGSGPQKLFVDDLLEKQRGRPLTLEDVLLDSTQYRIVLREVTNSTNERSLIAAVIPKGAVCVHTLHTIRPYKIIPSQEGLSEYPLHGFYERIFSDKELFAALGLLNSMVFDFLIRTKIDSHIVKYKFEESQVPRITEGDDWFQYIWKRAARLNCYGESFEEMRDRLGVSPIIKETARRVAQAEIDAAAFHAYKLNRDHVVYILENFYRVENPRIMTDAYFDKVLEKYDELAENGPAG